MKVNVNSRLDLPRSINETIRKLGLTRRQVVLRMGYRNENRGMRHLLRWLSGEARPRGDQLDRLGAALGIEREQIVRLIRSDLAELREQQRRLRARDRRSFLLIRLAAGIISSRVVPDGLTLEQARQWALSEVRALGSPRGFRFCIHTPDGVNHWFDQQGRLEGTSSGPAPCMQVGGTAFSLTLNRAPGFRVHDGCTVQGDDEGT